MCEDPSDCIEAGLNKPETRSIVGPVPYLFLCFWIARLRNPHFRRYACAFIVECLRSNAHSFSPSYFSRDRIQPAILFSETRDSDKSSTLDSRLAPEIKGVVNRCINELPKHLLKVQTTPGNVWNQFRNFERNGESLPHYRYRMFRVLSLILRNHKTMWNLRWNLQSVASLPRNFRLSSGIFRHLSPSAINSVARNAWTYNMATRTLPQIMFLSTIDHIVAKKGHRATLDSIGSYRGITFTRVIPTDDTRIRDNRKITRKTLLRDRRNKCVSANNKWVAYKKKSGQPGRGRRRVLSLLLSRANAIKKNW